MQKTGVFILTEGLISDYLLPLDKWGKIGKVHSIFEHSFNIQVEGHLINIANYHEYLSSFGIFLSEAEFEQIFPIIQKDSLVKIRKNQLTFFGFQGIHTLTTCDLQTVSLKVTPIKIERQQLKGIKKILEAEKLVSKIGLSMDEKLQEVIQSLTDDTLDPIDWEGLLNFLIGRGKGLTPSGDDLIVAYLSTLKMFGDSRAEELSSALTKHLTATTDISRAYIETSREGYVNSIFYKLFLDIKNSSKLETINVDLRRLMKIGHTSGKDLSFGFLLGIQTILNKKDKEKEKWII